MTKEFNDTIRNIATFALGAYKATDNIAFNTIYENLMSLYKDGENECFMANEDIKLMNMGIEELQFNVRTFNCLKGDNINLVKKIY